MNDPKIVEPREAEPTIICDGCGKPMEREGQPHDLIGRPAGTPTYCGSGFRVPPRAEKPSDDN